MVKPVKRDFFAMKTAAKGVTLTVAPQAESDNPDTPSQAPPDCEVTEYEGAEGWEQWQDSVFVQDFEDSIMTEPGTLSILPDEPPNS